MKQSFFYTTMYKAFPSPLKELARWLVRTAVCFLPNEHISVCCHLHCFDSNQKVLYEKPKGLDT